MKPPLESWRTFTTPITNGSDNRSRQNFLNVLAQYQDLIESHQRWQRDANGTKCNILASDFTASMGCTIPTREFGANGSLKEFNANDMADWLAGRGQVEHLWRECTMNEASERIEFGMPCIASNRNVGGIGHIAPIIPRHFQSAYDGLWIIQAGAKNFKAGKLFDGFAKDKRVRFFTHN